MPSLFRRARATIVLMGVSSLICGFAILLNPTGAALMLTAIVGGVMAISGVITLVGYFRDRGLGSQGDLLAGLLELVFGAILWLWPGLFVNWLVVFVAVFILFAGIGDLADARAFAAAGAPSAGTATVFAVLTIVFGVLVLVAPFALVDLMFLMAGFGLVFNGVTELVAAFRMK